MSVVREAGGDAERRLDEVRRQLAVLCRRASARFVPRSRERPCHWQPTEVRNPESEFNFTDAGAWEFIAGALERGVQLVEVELRHPQGKTGFVMKVPGVSGEPLIYVKLELGAGVVIGRSFHYSDTSSDD